MKFMKRIITAILIVVGVAVIFYYLFISMSNLPKGELISTVQCDSCGKTLNVYLVNGGAKYRLTIKYNGSSSEVISLSKTSTNS